MPLIVTLPYKDGRGRPAQGDFVAYAEDLKPEQAPVAIVRVATGASEVEYRHYNGRLYVALPKEKTRLDSHVAAELSHADVEKYVASRCKDVFFLNDVGWGIVPEPVYEITASKHGGTITIARYKPSKYARQFRADQLSEAIQVVTIMSINMGASSGCKPRIRDTLMVSNPALLAAPSNRLPLPNQHRANKPSPTRQERAIE